MAHVSRETLRETAVKHLEAYCTPGKVWNADAIQALRTRDCEHYLGPLSSLDEQFRGNINEEAHRNFMTFFGPIFSKFELKIRWEAVDAEKRVVAHGLDCFMDLKAFGDEPAVDNYTAEYVWTLWMDETGTKIIRVEEVVDLPRIMGYVVPRAAKYAQWAASQQDPASTAPAAH